MAKVKTHNTDDMSLEPSDFGQIALTEIRQDTLQNGYDCGFIALDTTREEVLNYIRTNIDDIAVRNLLLPEIRTFCAIECVMHQPNNATISEADKKQKLEEIFSISSALLGTEEINSVYDAINRLLSHAESEESGILLGNETGKEIKTLFDSYETVVANQQGKLVRSSEWLGYVVGNRKNYDELSNIFSSNRNNLGVSSEDFERARSLFMEAKQEIDTASAALDSVLRTSEVCRNYIENYYDRDNGWMAFQPHTSGGDNSSIVDVVAKMKECQIVVWQNSGEGMPFKVAYRTQDFTVSSGTVQRHMRYNGRNHFTKLQIASDERSIDTHSVGILTSPSLAPQISTRSNKSSASNAEMVFRNLVSGLEIVDEKDNILTAFDEIVRQIDVLLARRVVTLDQLQDSDLFTNLQDALFRISWRSSEISWAVKDALAVKYLAPWKNLEFLAQVLCDVTQVNHTKSFIVEALRGEELAQLRASMLKAKSIYTIGKHHDDKTDYKYPGWKSLSLFMQPSIDLFNRKLMSQHIATIEPLDYTIPIHRSALIEVLAILGECSKNLSIEAKAVLPLFRTLESIRDIIEHPKDYKFQADRLKEVENDTSGKLARLVANELAALSRYLSGDVVPLYQTIQFLNSKSVLSFAEKQELQIELEALSNSASSSGTRDYRELATFFKTHPRIDKKEQKEMADIIRKLDPTFSNNKADSVVKAVRKLSTPGDVDILESVLVSFLQPTVALSVGPLEYYMDLLDTSSPLQTKKELDTSLLRYQVSGTLEQKLRNYDARRRVYDKSTPDQGVSIASLSLDLKVVRIINSINTSINELISLVESKSSDSNEGALQLAVQRAFKKVAIVAGELSSEEEIKSGKLNASILPDNLLFLKKLRNIIAHRIFELDPALFMHTIETMISYMPVDLEEAKTRINSGEDFSTATSTAMTGVELYKHLYSKASQIRQSCQKFGVTYEKMHIVGRAVDKANDIGVQESIIFLLDQELTLNSQLKFEAQLKAVLGFKVKTYAPGQLQGQVGRKINKAHYDELQLSKTSFVDIVRDQHTKEDFRPGKYSYTNEQNESEYVASLAELEGKQIGLINRSFKEDEDKHHQRNATQAELLLRKPLTHIIIREKAALLNADLFPVISNWDFSLPRSTLQALLGCFIERMALERQKTELVKEWFYHEYEQKAWLPGTSKWYAKVEDQYSYKKGFDSDTQGVEYFIEEPRIMPDAQYRQFCNLHNQIMPLNKKMLSITTDENVLNKLLFFVKHLNEPLQIAAFLYTTPAAALEARLETLIYEIIVEQFQIPGAISNFGDALFGKKTWFEVISDEYYKRHKSEFRDLIKSKLDAGEYITPVLMSAYKRDQLENEAAPTMEGGYQELVRFAQNAALHNNVEGKHQLLSKLMDDYQSDETYSHKNNTMRNQLGVHTTKIKRAELEKEFGKVKAELVEISNSPEFQAFFEDKLYHERLELWHQVQHYVENNVKPRARTNRGGFIDDFCNSMVPEMQKQPDFDEGLLEQVRIFQSGRYDEWNESFQKWMQQTAEYMVVEYQRRSLFPGFSFQLDQSESNKKPRVIDSTNTSSSATSSASHVSRYQNSGRANCQVRS